MDDRQRIEAAAQHLRDACHIEDRRSFWRRLLASLRCKVTPSTDPCRPIKKIELTGGADF